MLIYTYLLTGICVTIISFWHIDELNNVFEDLLSGRKGVHYGLGVATALILLTIFWPVVVMREAVLVLKDKMRK